MDLGDDATGHIECGESSGPICPQSGRAASEGGSEDTYLPQGNRKLGVVFWRGGELKLSLFADADYADECNDRRSVSGVVAVMLGNTAASASSTTQHRVTLSTSEAEYAAMAHGAKAALAIKAVLDFV